MSKRTVIIGASPNPTRYSYRAAEMLIEHGHEIVPVGIKRGAVFGKDILDVRSAPAIDDVDTVTLYVGESNQEGLQAYIEKLRPRRVIFNPGAENTAMAKHLEKEGIETLEACTLVMLRSGQY